MQNEVVWFIIDSMEFLCNVGINIFGCSQYVYGFLCATYRYFAYFLGK